MDDDVHFTPDMVIASATEPRGLRVEQLGVAPVVVLAWSVKLVRSLAEIVGAVLSEHWMYRERHPLYVGEIGGQRVTFAHVPAGAPGTVMMMEEMVAAGAPAFWGFGAGGSLPRGSPDRRLHHPHLRHLRGGNLSTLRGGGYKNTPGYPPGNDCGGELSKRKA
ncbi:MAG: hypothetical protein NVSMB22_18170 [Chloroflexota bacterium]